MIKKNKSITKPSSNEENVCTKLFTKNFKKKSDDRKDGLRQLEK